MTSMNSAGPGASLRDPRSPSFANPSLSRLRLHGLRAAYLLIGIGLALTKWPLLGQIQSLDVYEAVTLCMLTAMSLLALVGVARPAAMIPVLMFEVLWKLLWLGLVAAPALVAGNADASVTRIAVNCTLVVPVLLAVPWRYVWRVNVKGRPR